MRITYDVLKEPWIPVADQTGEARYYGILDVLAKAHELKEITDASPLVEYGLYRLLCVFLMDALRPEESFDIEDLLAEGRFDMEQIEAYVSRCQAEGASFDLFDEKRPFLQTPYVPKWDREEKSVGYLDQHIPAGNNHTHFNHAGDSASLSYQEAARLLPACYIFAVKGGAGYHTSINGRPPFFALVKGENLFQTLIYTLLPVKEIPDFDRIPVFWNCKDPVIPKHGMNRVSWLYGMLFPARRITLIPKEEKISKIYFGPGMFLENSDNWIDPHVTYMTTKKGRETLFPEENNPIWKNLNHLISIEGKDAPQIICHYMENFGSSGSIANISLYGLQTKRDVVSYSELICRDLRISTGFFNVQGELLVGECIKEAEQLGDIIKKAFEFKIFKPSQKPHGIGHIMALDAEQEFYHRCEILLMDLCGRDLSAEEIDGEAVVRAWKRDLYQMGREVRDSTLAKVSLTGQQWITAYQKQERLNRYLLKLKKEGDLTNDGKH